MKHHSPASPPILAAVTLAIGLATFLLPATAGLVLSRKIQIEGLLLGGLRSHWKANDGSQTEMWILSLPDGSLEFKGRDSAATYEGLVAVDTESDTFTCNGTGFRFEDGRLFTYQSSLRLAKSDQGTRLLQQWTATFSDGHTVTGETTLDANPSSEKKQ